MNSHIFNERWPGDVRFHGVTALAMIITLSSANIWSVWSSESGGQPAGRGWCENAYQPGIFRSVG